MGDDDKRVHPFLLSGLLFWLRRKVFAPMKRLLEAKIKMAELRSLEVYPFTLIRTLLQKINLLKT